MKVLVLRDSIQRREDEEEDEELRDNVSSPGTLSMSLREENYEREWKIENEELATHLTRLLSKDLVEIRLKEKLPKLDDDRREEGAGGSEKEEDETTTNSTTAYLASVRGKLPRRFFYDEDEDDDNEGDDEQCALEEEREREREEGIRSFPKSLAFALTHLYQEE